MMPSLAGCAVALVRLWTHVYTWRAEAAATRRGEIDSDLWELLHDPECAGEPWIAWHLVRRMLGGMSDDLLWRYEQLSPHESLLMRRALTTMCAIVILGILLLGPARSLSGRSEVLQCADAAAPADNTQYRLQVVSCAGAFFLTRSNGS